MKLHHHGVVFFLSVLPICAFLCAFSGCPARTKRLAQGIKINCSYSDARVFVNGHFLGRGRRVFNKLIKLPPGRHLVEVRLDGHYTRYREIEVKRDNVQVIKLSLHPQLQWKTRKTLQPHKRPITTK